MFLASAAVCCTGSQISIAAVGIQALSQLGRAQSWEGEDELGSAGGSKHCRLCSAQPSSSISMARRSAASARLAPPSGVPLLFALITHYKAATVNLMATLPPPLVLLSESECVCACVRR